MDKPSSVALFVDIENIRISAALETAIVKMFPTAEILKIAVGNFRLLHLDRELQERGYHLVHVPSGNNNADREILNLSWLVKNYQEIVIVSNDKIFIKFIYQFNAPGKTAYIVHRSKAQTAEFFITTSRPLLIEDEQSVPINSQSKINLDKRNKTLPVNSSDFQFTSKHQFLHALKTLVAENNQIDNPSKLAVEFHKKFGIKVSLAIKNCKISINFNQLVIDHNIIAPLDPKEQLIINIKELIKQHPRLAKNPSLIGTKFKEIHGVSISEKMKQVGISEKPAEFLAQIHSTMNAQYN